MLLAEPLVLPVPGIMVSLSPAYCPPILKGIKVFPDDPFKFEFILDQNIVTDNRTDGRRETLKSQTLTDYDLKQESQKLVKYFLSSLTVPEKELWVNLSPYEKDRIVPESFGQTEMGRDLLAQDYLLKQVTATLVYPEGDIGKQFWKRVYEEANKSAKGDISPRHGLGGNVQVKTFNKVWIVPEKAVVYENAKAGTAYVVESGLRVLTEQDYLSTTIHEAEIHGVGAAFRGRPTQGNNQTLPSGRQAQIQSSQIIRDIVIPQLTKEVNEGKNFAQLRQIYNSLILATWYKKKIKDSILAQVYADKNKVKGIEYKGSVILGVGMSYRGRPLQQGNNPTDVDLIYQQYLQAFKKGAYNYIKEEQDPASLRMIPKKYFSGGLNMAMASVIKIETSLNPAMISDPTKSVGNIVEVRLTNAVVRNIPRVTFSHQLERSRSAINALLPDGGVVWDIGIGENAVSAFELASNPKLKVVGIDTRRQNYDVPIPENYSFVPGNLFSLNNRILKRRKADIPLKGEG